MRLLFAAKPTHCSIANLPCQIGGTSHTLATKDVEFGCSRAFFAQRQHPFYVSDPGMAISLAPSPSSSSSLDKCCQEGATGVIIGCGGGKRQESSANNAIDALFHAVKNGEY